MVLTKCENIYYLQIKEKSDVNGLQSIPWVKGKLYVNEGAIIGLELNSDKLPTVSEINEDCLNFTFESDESRFYILFDRDEKITDQIEQKFNVDYLNNEIIGIEFMYN